MGLDALSGGGRWKQDKKEKKKKKKLYSSLYSSLKATQSHQKLSHGGKEECLLGSDSLSGDFDVGLLACVYNAGNIALNTPFSVQKHWRPLGTYGSTLTSQSLFISCVWGELSPRNYFLSLEREFINNSYSIEWWQRSMSSVLQKEWNIDTKFEIHFSKWRKLFQTPKFQDHAICVNDIVFLMKQPRVIWFKFELTLLYGRGRMHFE